MAAFGTLRSAVAVPVWLVGYLVLLTNSAMRGSRSGREIIRVTAAAAVWVAAPFLLALWMLVPMLFDPELRLPLVGGAVAAVVIGFLTVAGIVGVRRRHIRRPASKSRGSRSRALVSAVVALSLYGVPFWVQSASHRALLQDVAPCDDMDRHAPVASHETLRIMAEACGQRNGPGKAVARAGDVRIEAYPGRHNADYRLTAEYARSFVDHTARLLGPPGMEQVHVSPVAIPGPVRGMAGPGYLLIDHTELDAPQACGRFRSSAGRHGTCGLWVVAHELAHLWFPGLSGVGPAEDRVAWEATADYLAWDWWRSTFGEADAARLTRQLFEGRVALDREFAMSRAPADPPSYLTDFQDRALIRGRGPLGLIEAENSFGRPAVMEVLRKAFAGMGDGPMTIEVILDAAQEVSPQLAAVLDSWWMQPSLGGPALGHESYSSG